MVFRKQAALAVALASVIVMLGCTDELNGPNTTDEQPVLPPTNVSAFALTDGHVRVKWDASSEPTISGYNLYRREAGHGKPGKLNSGRIHAHEYVDESTVALKNYEYRLTAVNSKGKESRYVAVIVETRTIVDGTSGKYPAVDTN
ncbi:MAG TPA: fibronectin type III domain-containing protein [Candidatus Krumholzibacteria bacterium]|nr:fibronectin type III domain-containing protein [Candidatus Krumholzibacteria bacterium]